MEKAAQAKKTGSWCQNQAIMGTSAESFPLSRSFLIVYLLSILKNRGLEYECPDLVG